MNNDKLVVAAFTPESQAKEAGVMSGDILRRVDGVDVLAVKAEVTLTIAPFRNTLGFLAMRLALACQ